MYSHVVLGGTFDQLHAGHEALLQTAFSLGMKVTLGLTKASMNRSKAFSAEIQPFNIRKKQLISFAHRLGRAHDLRVIAIQDVYGTTLRDTTLEAIIVTELTKNGAQQINEHREQRGLRALSIEVCPLFKDESDTVLSSSRIREGLVSRDGKLYESIIQEVSSLSSDAREKLQHPFGKAVGAVKLLKSHRPLIVVGDVVTQYCMDHGIPFTTAYVDGRSQRSSYFLSLRTEYSLRSSIRPNPAGIIRLDTALAMREDLSVRNTIQPIDGEEDLLTVAGVLLLPFGTEIVYGYPYEPKSMRCIRVSDTMKTKFRSILQGE